MNVTKIRLIGLHTIDLPIVVAQPSDPYLVKDITGLGPSAAAVSIPNSAGIGGVYQGRRAQNKDFLFRVELTPDYRINQTAADLREQLYGLFTPDTDDDSVLVQFLQGPAVVAETKGWVSGIEPVYFTKTPECNVSIDTAWPYLQAPTPVTAVPSTKDAFSITNAGSAPTGFEAEVVFTAAATTWTLTLGPRQMTFEYAFKAGDILRFNTKPKSRSITRVRAGVELDLLYTLTPTSSWLELKGGANNFTTSSNLFNWGYIRYVPQYLGV